MAMKRPLATPATPTRDATAAARSAVAPAQASEPLLYARLLDGGARIGLVLLVLAMLAYLTGVLTPHVDVQRLPQLWHLPAGRFLAETHTPGGWGWLALLRHGDIVPLLGIALLAGCSLPPLLALMVIYARRGDRVFALLCAAEVAVVLLAASGVLAGGHG
jgi:hypothetical protein